MSLAVGEHSKCSEDRSARTIGALGREYAGISNDKTGEKPVRRKSKVSDARSFRVGLVGSLAEAERRR